jgi:hypothetical protein
MVGSGDGVRSEGMVVQLQECCRWKQIVSKAW